MAKTYFEKLKDPRWQRKRLDALQAADFACQICYDTESTLHVHHKQYFKGRDPWEYDTQQLAVLCEVCHSAHHEAGDALHLVTSYLPMDGLFSRDSVASLVAGFANINVEFEGADQVLQRAGALAERLFANHTLKGSAIAGLVDLSATDSDGMLNALLAYAASKGAGGS
jgi:hypothetical protein